MPQNTYHKKLFTENFMPLFQLQLPFLLINSSVISNISSSVVFILGSTYFEDRKKFLDLYNSYESYYMSIVFALYAITYILILPFMKLYTSGITDINYIDLLLPTLFVIINLLSHIRMPGAYAINIAGDFKKTQYRSIFEAAINIIISLICVNKLGIYGVLIGSIIALLYRSNDIILYTSKHILKRNPWITYKKCFINIIIFLTIETIVSKINISIQTYSKLLLIGIILLVTATSLFFMVVSIFDTKSFNYIMGISQKYLSKFRTKCEKVD